MPWAGFTRLITPEPAMTRTRNITAVALCTMLLTGCGVRPFAQPAPPPPIVRPTAFIALGLSAAYLNSDVISGTRARAAKLRAAKIRPLAAAAVPNYMNRAEQELRRQTAGIGI